MSSRTSFPHCLATNNVEEKMNDNHSTSPPPSSPCDPSSVFHAPLEMVGPFALIAAVTSPDRYALTITQTRNWMELLA